MPQFSYYGRNARKEAVQGMLEASSTANVVDWLAQSGITPVSITEVKQVAEASDVLGKLLGKDRIDDVELMMFTRQLYTLSKAGVPIIRAFRSLEQSAESKGLKQLYNELAAGLESGVELSQTMARRSDVFDTFYVSMVRVGETTGRLEEVYIGLFHHLEFQRYMREQVKSALRYPSFVIMAMVGAIGIINIFVIPAFAKVFASLHAELPLMTRILLGTSQFTLTWWPAILAGVVLAAIGWHLFVGSDSGRLAWDRTKLRLPIAGELIQKGVLAQA
uniref:type II secretion system F family protein n=1 Tax=Aquabacterium sp. TaxID=1872578 RepID=UPI0035B3DAB0